MNKNFPVMDEIYIYTINPLSTGTAKNGRHLTTSLVLNKQVKRQRRK